MTTPYKFAHEFDATPAQFWQVFLADDYNIELYRRIGVKERKVIERTDHGDTMTWAIRIMPERDLPGFLKKILGGDLGYVEISTLHKKENRIDVKVEPTLLKDRTRFEGIFTLDVLPGGRLRRTFAGDMTVSVPLAGKKIEDLILQDMHKAYDLSAEVMREYLKKLP